MKKLYILVEPSLDHGWICYNGEETDRERCLANGGWVMPQEDVDKIFGNLVSIVSPLNTHVSEDGQTVTFDHPSDKERKEKLIEMLNIRLTMLQKECDSYLSPTQLNSMDFYQKKIWTAYRKALDDFPNLPGFPWLDQPKESIPWPVKPEKNAVPQTLENMKELKLEQLTEAFNNWMDSSNSSMASSTGYTVNANNTAKKNIDGIITAMESTKIEKVSFMCFDNTLALLTLQELKTIQIELIQYGSALYARKWQYRSQIENAKTIEEASSIKFDFSDVSI